ncbi:MAG TPA: condensation domain-containing protein, partial [Candidatus Angelobacter sp.]|nr:condensation domain-containing protein [Candidatus Angelobacter sp.]
MLKDAIKICPQDAIEKPQMANGEENSFRTDVKNVLTFALADRLGTTAQNINTQTPIARYGIDSLAAVEIAHTVESMCDVKLSFEMLLEGLSIEEIAISLEPPTYSRPIRSLPPVELSGDADWELSPGQEALWHIHRQAPLSSAYNIATAMRIRSSLDKDLLQKCLDTLVERHALLRATFSQSGGRTFQHIHKTMNVAFQTEDASAWSERAGKDHVAEEAERPFDLERGPLVKVHLWTYGADDHLLLIVVHHIIADLWSLAMLLRELFTLYEHRRRLTLPASPVQYSSYIEWQRNMLDAPEGNEHWNYWRNQLQDSFSVLDLPTDHPRPEIQSYRGSSEVDVLDQEATNGLKELSARYGVTLHMTLLAVYQTLLHRYTSQEELTIGSVLTGRTKSEWAGIFGYFVNSLPLVAQLQGQTLFSQFLSQVRRTVIEALNHQDYPLSTLVGRLGRTRTPGRSPLFDSLFVFQQSPFGTMPELSAFALGLEGTSLNIGGLRVESVPAERQATTSDLTFMVGDSGNGIGISVKYRTDLFEPATVRRMLGHFRTLAKAVSGNPAESILSLPLLTEAERRMILFEWNSNRSRAHSAEPEVVCISDLIEKHANTTPNAPAVVFENDCLTYSQLYDRATCIAAYLRRLGVGPEESVAVCLERGVEIITAIVGIMKAGGAYVPLDPAEPPARITSMLQVVQPRVVLT